MYLNDKRAISILLGIFLFFVYAISYGTEPFPKKEFMEITKEAIDILDTIEVLLNSQDSSLKTKMEIDEAFKKLDVTLLKYGRYLKETDFKKIPKDSKQIKITQAIGAAQISLHLASIELGLNNIEKEISEKSDMESKNLKEAWAKTQKVRELFSQYR